MELAVYNKTIYFCFSMQVCFFFSVIGPAASKFLEKWSLKVIFCLLNQKKKLEVCQFGWFVRDFSHDNGWNGWNGCPLLK